MKEIIKSKIEELLSKEYYCSLSELNGRETVYSINTNAKQPYIKILAYGKCVVVCTSKELHTKIQEILQDKNRDEIFEVPFVYGQTIHYVPDHSSEVGEAISSKYVCEFLLDKDILSLNGLKGFENSLAFDDNGSAPTKAVYIARDKGRIIGTAGAAESPVNGLWEIGVDVMEEYRNAKLGTYLVSKLTKELLARNKVPFYSASVTNISSQMVACRCGYVPLWVDTFGTTLDGSSVYKNLDLQICM